ncbi:MAG: hypothetical protein J6S80_04390 [Alphaproteobacteria bacterium]|nr:hypothetical protein [Alphaproteobacteria bacterium]
MTKQDSQTLRRSVINNVNKILLNSTFADKIDTTAKISDLAIFGQSDIALIKERIADMFKIDITQDISDFSIGQLHTMIFIHVCNSESLTKKFMDLAHKTASIKVQQPIRHKHTSDNSDDKTWNLKLIFAHIIKEITPVYGRSVQSKEKLSELISEAQDAGRDTSALTKKLKELEEFFNIKIDLSMRIYNIARTAEQSFIAQGKAVDSKVERSEMDPYWAPLYDTMSFKYLKDVIYTDFGVRISTYKLCHAKSYEEYVKLIQDAQQRKAERLKEQRK